MMLARAGGLLLSRQTLRAARFLCRMRIAASSARRFNSASSGVNRKNSKRRLLISSSPVFFAPSFLYSTRRAFSRAAGFRYLSIAPVLLGPGTYTIGGFYGAPFGDFALFHASITSASGVSYVASRSAFGFTFPTGDVQGFSNGYFGPNFQFYGTHTRLRLDSFSARLRFARLGWLAAQIELLRRVS
jgi:hypothetical protein